jgi:hypothetical protein
MLDIAALHSFREEDILDCSHILVVVHSPVGAGSLGRTGEFLALDQSHPH